jgi:nucleoside-diphosphate-sugar epimerase
MIGPAANKENDIKILRTPDSRFENLPGWPFEPHYTDITDPDTGQALRMAWVDEGPREGPAVLLLHGEPSWSYLYRHIIGQLVAGAESLNLGALHPTRDFTYVSDTVSGFIAALNSTAGVGKVANLGTGFEVTIERTARLIMEIVGREVPIVGAGERMRPQGSEVERLCADNSLARQWWGWSPTLVGEAGLRDGLRRTVEWFSDPTNLAMYHATRYVV